MDPRRRVVAVSEARGAPGQELLDLDRQAEPVVHRAGGAGRRRRRTGAPPVPVLVAGRVLDPVAVLVDAVADLLRAGMDPGPAVVAVPGLEHIGRSRGAETGRRVAAPAVAVAVEPRGNAAHRGGLVHRAIAVLVRAVADLRGGGGDARVPVVTVTRDLHPTRHAGAEAGLRTAARTVTVRVEPPRHAARGARGVGDAVAVVVQAVAGLRGRGLRGAGAHPVLGTDADTGAVPRGAGDVAVGLPPRGVGSLEAGAAVRRRAVPALAVEALGAALAAGPRAVCAPGVPEAVALEGFVRPGVRAVPGLPAGSAPGRRVRREADVDQIRKGLGGEAARGPPGAVLDAGDRAEGRPARGPGDAEPRGAVAAVLARTAEAGTRPGLQRPHVRVEAGLEGCVRLLLPCAPGDAVRGRRAEEDFVIHGQVAAATGCGQGHHHHRQGCSSHRPTSRRFGMPTRGSLVVIRRHMPAGNQPLRVDREGRVGYHQE